MPLKEAWISGAKDWTSAQRESFANDLTRPQLVAVTDNLNESKGERFPRYLLLNSGVRGTRVLQSYMCMLSEL